MSSSDHLHPQQLQMFMPAGELRQRIPKAYDHLHESVVHDVVEGMWAKKLEESKSGHQPRGGDGRSLHAAIASEGITHSALIDVEDLTIVDGHHRVVTASDIDPQMEVPVTYRE